MRDLVRASLVHRVRNVALPDDLRRIGGLARIEDPAVQHQRAVLGGGISENQVRSSHRRAGPVDERIAHFVVFGTKILGSLRIVQGIQTLGFHLEKPRVLQIVKQRGVESRHVLLGRARSPEIGDGQSRFAALAGNKVSDVLGQQSGRNQNSQHYESGFPYHFCI